MEYRRAGTGEVLVLSSRPVGVGGEACVYAISGHDNIVAKVYHKPKPEHAAKLRVMTANPPDDPMLPGHISIAWPIDLILDLRSDRPVGFLMPRCNQTETILTYFYPGRRRDRAPLFNYKYLLTTAFNLATAANALHARGCVIGDVNERNFLVDDRALVTVVDTDSFQIRDKGTGLTFRCPVGTLEYTPTELQGQVFADVDREPEHDRFGLAMLFFQLLMEGTHPYDGVYAGAGEPPTIESRIKRGYSPYRSQRSVLRPKPGAPRFETLAPELQILFRRCLDDGHDRPDARPVLKEWKQVLEVANSRLVCCSKNSQHWFDCGLSDCPWCERMAMLGGRDPFPPRDAVTLRPHSAVLISNINVGGIQKTSQHGKPAVRPPHPPTTNGVIAFVLAFLALTLTSLSVITEFRVLAGTAGLALGIFGWLWAARHGSRAWPSKLFSLLALCVLVFQASVAGWRGVGARTKQTLVPAQLKQTATIPPTAPKTLQGSVSATELPQSSQTSARNQSEILDPQAGVSWVRGSSLIAKYGTYIYETLNTHPQLLADIRRVRPGFVVSNVAVSVPSQEARLPGNRHILVMHGCRAHACPSYFATIGLEEATNDVFVLEEGEESANELFGKADPLVAALLRYFRSEDNWVYDLLESDEGKKNKEAQQYADWARQSLEKGNTSGAYRSATRASILAPSDPAILALKSSIFSQLRQSTPSAIEALSYPPPRDVVLDLLDATKAAQSSNSVHGLSQPAMAADRGRAANAKLPYMTGADRTSQEDSVGVDTSVVDGTGPSKLTAERIRGDAPTATPNLAMTVSSPESNSQSQGQTYWQVLTVRDAAARQTGNRVVDALKKKGLPAFLSVGSTNSLRVIVGPYNDAKSAQLAKSKLENAGFYPLEAEGRITEITPGKNTYDPSGPQPGTIPVLKTDSTSATDLNRSGRPSPPTIKPIEEYWEVEALATPEDAALIRNALERNGFAVSVKSGPYPMMQVLVGPYGDNRSFARAKLALERRGFHPKRFSEATELELSKGIPPSEPKASGTKSDEVVSAPSDAGQQKKELFERLKGVFR